MNAILLLNALASMATTQNAPTAFAVPPPIEQYTTDCTRPVYASDQLVCGEPELRASDDRLVRILRENPQLGQRASSTYFEAQSEWFKRRSLCAMKADHRQCVSASYSERIRVLEMLGKTNVATKTSKSCRPGTGLEAISLIRTAPDGIAIYTKSGEVAGLATRQSEKGGWLPYVRYNKVRSNVVLLGLSGPIGKCRYPG